MSIFLKGIIYTSFASVFWGLPQVLFFNNIKNIPPIEIISHRALWSFVLLFLLVFFSKKFIELKKIFLNKKIIFFLSITALLVSFNWFLFILSISINRVQDASMGYFISPIISVGLGYIFFKEKLSILQIISLILIIFSIIFLLFKLKIFPFLAVGIALSWAFYGLIRKKININPEIGLTFESGFLSIIALSYLFFLYQTNENFFINSEINIKFLLMCTGIVTVIPLFFFNLGVKVLPLGVTGIIFFLNPTFQFLTSVFILKETIIQIKVISFIIIWIAIIIFLLDKFKTEYKLNKKNTNESSIQLPN